MNTLHWTASLVGLPWQAGAEGPRAFDCWGLVRHAVQLRFGESLPPVHVGGDGNRSAIAEAARRSGWRRADGQMAEDDIVLMHGPRGPHIGFAVVTRQAGLRLLHSNGYRMANGLPWGCVVLQPLRDVACDGYSNFEIWRHA